MIYILSPKKEDWDVTQAVKAATHPDKGKNLAMQNPKQGEDLGYP